MSLLLLSMITLITRFTCPPTTYFKFITKCDKCYYKARQLFLLQSAMVCYYKLRQLFYYKVRQVLLQSATGITKCDSTDQPSQDGVLSLHFPFLHVILEAPTKKYDGFLHENITTLPWPNLSPIRPPFSGCPGSLQFPVKKRLTIILAMDNVIVSISTNKGRDTILQRSGPQERKER